MLAALIAAGCGSGKKTSSTKSASTASSKCAATVGFEGPITGAVGSLGEEQLAFANLAISNDNKANGTNISLAEGDTQLTPSMATTVSQKYVANPNIVAVVGPAGSPEVEAVGPLFARAGIAFVSGSATETTLTGGANPTFFRVVASDAKQGQEDARFIIDKLHPKALMIIDDQEGYSTALVGLMIPFFRAAGIAVDHESVSQSVTDFSSLVGKITPAMTVAVLPWQVAANGEQFGKDLAEQHKRVTIVGTDWLYSPSSFTIPGSYVSSFAPDITGIPADRSLVSQAKAAFPNFGIFGPSVYAATHVVDEAIASVCKSGQRPTRSNVLPAIESTNESTSILGQPIKFDSHGDLVNAKWFLFHINAKGQYQLVTSS